MTQSTLTRPEPPDDSGSGTFGFNFDGVSNDDIKAGLPAIIYARWVLVIAGLGLTLWNMTAGEFDRAQYSILIILGLAVGNFFLQVEVNRKRAIPTWIVYTASVVDISAISLVLALSNTFPSSTFVFYMPALLALSITFSTANTAKFTAAALFAYVLISIAPINDMGGDKVVATGLLVHAMVLVAVPFCGNVYWRLEKSRRTRELQTDLTEQQLTASFETTTIGDES